MARFDDLPADQKAVLQLVLRQGRTYEEIAGLLRITPDAVRDRALNALDALGPDDPGDLPDERQDEVGDYLLGQQTASRRAATREFLEGSAAGRAWARVLSGELRASGLTDDLPDVPAEPQEVEEAFDALDARHRAREEREKSSKLGGVLLLAGLGILVAVVLLWALDVFEGGDDGDDRPVATQTATTTTGGGATAEAQINLTSPNQGSKALGVAQIISQDGQRGIAVVGQDLQPSRFYALWLRGEGNRSKILGFFPPVTGKGESKGRLQGLVQAPQDLAQYDQILVTREREQQPKSPGTVILRGTLEG